MPTLNDTHCPFCGAPTGEGMTCEDRFHALGILEITFPELAYAGHFFMVANYMLQHNGYSDAARSGMISMLEAAVEQGITTEQFRRDNRDKLDSGNRKYKITEKNPKPFDPQIAWTMTIADIDPDDPEAYVDRVIEWSKSILATIRENPKVFGEIIQYRP